MDEKKVQIRAKDDDLKGKYANMMMARHTKEEFCLDFISNFDPPILVSRILMSPGHLKRMIRALEENLKRYEEQYGEVEVAQKPDASVGFRAQ